MYTLTQCTVHTPHRSQYAVITLTTSCTTSTYLLLTKFYVHGTVHLSIYWSYKYQRDANFISLYWMLELYMFRTPFASIIRSTINCSSSHWCFLMTLSSIQDLFHPKSWQTPVTAATVYSTPDDGRKGRPKHVGF